MIELVFATHSTSLDNERGTATGWLPGALSPTGRDQARALETAVLAFDGDPTPRFVDWRLRECNYGDLNGRPTAEVHGSRLAHLDVPYPGGESYRDVVTRVDSFLADLRPRWDGARVLLIGHSATRYALAHLLTGADLASTLATPGDWQPGWSYTVQR